MPSAETCARPRRTAAAPAGSGGDANNEGGAKRVSRQNAELDSIREDQAWSERHGIEQQLVADAFCRAELPLFAEPVLPGGDARCAMCAQRRVLAARDVVSLAVVHSATRCRRLACRLRIAQARDPRAAVRRTDSSTVGDTSPSEALPRETSELGFTRRQAGVAVSRDQRAPSCERSLSRVAELRSRKQRWCRRRAGRWRAQCEAELR